MIQTGNRGSACTADERALVEQSGEHVYSDSTTTWLLLAQRIGVEALVAVLDELGGEKVHVPQRGTFFAELYRPIRNAQIRQLRAQEMGLSEIGAVMQMDRRRVWEVLSGVRDDAPTRTR